METRIKWYHKESENARKCRRKKEGGGTVKQIKNIGLRVTPEIHAKLRSIAQYEGRTINGQVLWLINRCIREFERENGEIEIVGEED